MEDSKQGGIFFAGFPEIGSVKRYPGWRYHDLLEPIIVENTEEDLAAAKRGYGEPEELITSVPTLKNFFHDLEDFNERQLVAYVREEFGLELPALAGKEALMKAIWQLYHICPKYEGNMVLLAQAIEMNFDATIAEIQRIYNDPNAVWEVTTQDVEV